MRLNEEVKRNQSGSVHPPLTLEACDVRLRGPKVGSGGLSKAAPLPPPSSASRQAPPAALLP